MTCPAPTHGKRIDHIAIDHIARAMITSSTEVKEWWDQQRFKHPPELAEGGPDEASTAREVADLRGVSLKTTDNEVRAGLLPAPRSDGTFRRGEVVAELRRRPIWEVVKYSTPRMGPR